MPANPTPFASRGGEGRTTLHLAVRVEIAQASLSRFAARRPRRPDPRQRKLQSTPYRNTASSQGIRQISEASRVRSAQEGILRAIRAEEGGERLQTIFQKERVPA